MKLLNDEQHEFLINNYKGIGNKELTELINNTFKTNFTKDQIKRYKNNRHLDSGLNGYFEKGIIGWNKGKKWDEYMSKEAQNNSRKTCYKKGNVAKNVVSIGTEKWRSGHKNREDEGFLYVKIKDGEKNNNWIQKHRLLWEQHYGEIPKGHKVIFRDGNRHNITIDNLALVSNSEMLILNRNNMIYENKDLTDLGIKVAKLIDTANKKMSDKNGRKRHI